MCFKQHVRSFGRKRFEVISLCGGGGLKLNICITLFVRHNWKIPRTSFLSLEYSNCEVIFCVSFDWFLTRWLTHRDGRYLNLVICSRRTLWETSFPRRDVKTIKMMVAKFFCILISAFQVKGFCSARKCEKISFNEQQDAYHDKELVGHVFHNSVTSNSQQCYLWCINDCRCLSINYKVKNDIKYCELNEGSHFTNKDSLKNITEAFTMYCGENTPLRYQTLLCNKVFEREWFSVFILV